MLPQCTFYIQYISEVTSASDSQNKTTNQGFLESCKEFPAYKEFPAHPEESSPQGECENVSHIRYTTWESIP